MKDGLPVVSTRSSRLLVAQKVTVGKNIVPVEDEDRRQKLDGVHTETCSVLHTSSMCFISHYT